MRGRFESRGHYIRRGWWSWGWGKQGGLVEKLGWAPVGGWLLGEKWRGREPWRRRREGWWGVGGWHWRKGEGLSGHWDHVELNQIVFIVRTDLHVLPSSLLSLVLRHTLHLHTHTHTHRGETVLTHSYIVHSCDIALYRGASCHRLSYWGVPVCAL